MLKQTILQKTITFIMILTLIAFNIHTKNLQTVTTSVAPEKIKLAVLMYHGFTESGKESTYVISAKSFEDDIIYLKENGFEFINCNDLINYTKYHTPLPEKSVMMTIDDGYLNNYVYAFPIIKKHNIKVVISPIASCSDFNTRNPDSNTAYANMTWSQIKEMSDSGLVEIQNHSYNMHSLENGRKGSAKAQGENSRDYIKAFFNDFMKAHKSIYNATGIPPVAYAYPFGSMSEESKYVLKCFEYKVSFSCNSGLNYITSNPDDLFMLKRFNRTPETSVSKLLCDY